MASSELTALLRSFKSLSGATAAISAFVPCIGYLSSLSPPLFPEGAPGLTSALALATIVLVNHRELQRPKKTNRKPVLSLVMALVLLIAYAVLLDSCTVTSPRTEAGLRYQIGFAKWEDGLTEEGKVVKAASPSATEQDWMMDDGLFRPGGPRILWKAWTIYAAGAGMILVFMFMFVLWVGGWTLIAVRHSAKREASRGRK